MIKAVIFDMDGLMFDTERLALPCTAQAARENGWQMEPEDVRAVIGCNFRSAEEHFRSVYGEGFDYAPVRERALALMSEHIDREGIPLKAGLLHLLDYLRQNNIRFTVATSSNEPTARRYFESAGISGYFGEIMSGEKVERGKPDPQIYLRAAELLGVAADECVVLEDSLYGIESAYLAGMTPIMIPDLVEPTEGAKKMAYRVLGDLWEAKNVIEMLTEDK
ncbi:MAG: HAD family phosphatase [Clostridia bacterium]|nr:HAD family phosphatase [Clostridia bacterium]